MKGDRVGLDGDDEELAAVGMDDGRKDFRTNPDDLVPRAAHEVSLS
jgi:hypothetical protein